jgi:hypothetical protein
MDYRLQLRQLSTILETRVRVPTDPISDRLGRTDPEAAGITCDKQLYSDDTSLVKKTFCCQVEPPSRSARTNHPRLGSATAGRSQASTAALIVEPGPEPAPVSPLRR